MVRWLVAVAVLAAAAAPSAAAVTVQQVEKGIRDYMNRKFKCTALKVQVLPCADPSLLQEGRLQTVVITVKRADRVGIIMNDLYLKATDVTISLDALFRLGKLRTLSRKSTDIRATIKEKELNKAFARAKLPIQQFTVKFENGMLVATGVYQFVFGNKLKMIGRLVPKRDGIHFVARQASVNDLPLPLGEVNALLAKMNPIIGFADIPFSPDVTKILIQRDTLTMSG
ncbi:MAG: LmeA family phospholipid-binding protein [Armatimonadota bacterium]